MTTRLLLERPPQRRHETHARTIREKMLCFERDLRDEALQATENESVDDASRKVGDTRHARGHYSQEDHDYAERSPRLRRQRRCRDSCSCSPEAFDTSDSTGKP